MEGKDGGDKGWGMKKRGGKVGGREGMDTR